MKWFTTYGIWILLLIAALVLGIIWYRRNKNNNVSFDFTITDDLNSILNNLTNSNQRSTGRSIGLYIDVPFASTITNNSAISKTLQNIVGSISYNGNNIMQTNANSPALASVTVPAKGTAPITDSVQMLINTSSIDLITKIIQGKNPVVKYNFNTNISGQAYSFSNSIPIKKL